MTAAEADTASATKGEVGIHLPALSEMEHWYSELDEAVAYLKDAATEADDSDFDRAYRHVQECRERLAHLHRHFGRALVAEVRRLTPPEPTPTEEQP